jgi:hypothetical protein
MYLVNKMQRKLMPHQKGLRGVTDLVIPVLNGAG